jgi:S1-C subfamily serine protease
MRKGRDFTPVFALRARRACTLPGGADPGAFIRAKGFRLKWPRLDDPYDGYAELFEPRRRADRSVELIRGSTLHDCSGRGIIGAMKLIRPLLLSGAGLITLACTVPTPDQIFEQASRSVVTVFAADASRKIVGHGSGVFVDKDLLVTSCHVIARGKVFVVRHAQERSFARLVAYDADKDLCALNVQGLDVTPARIGDATTLRVGQRVYAIGTPEGFELTLSEGLISGLREAGGGRYIQTTAPMSEGSSGGGLFDSSGRLIGITAFVFSAGQNLNFAAPADWASDLAKKVSGAGREGSAEEIELPPAFAKQWRHPLLK